nr:MAG TPA: hypothetical protein [Caudoviricetes sp.]
MTIQFLKSTLQFCFWLINKAYGNCVSNFM